MTEKHPAAAVAEADEIEALFVQTAHAVACHDGKLTLRGLAPTTLMFSDRPDRVTGQRTGGPDTTSVQGLHKHPARAPPSGLGAAWGKR
jgi:hypothetical protein